MQRALRLGRLRRGRLGRLRRLDRLDLRTARRVHHFADRARFGLGGLATLANLFLLGARLVGRFACGVLGLLRRFALRGALGGRTRFVLSALLGRLALRALRLLARSRGLLRGFRLRRRRALRRGFLFRTATLGLGRLFARTALGFLALETLLTLAQFLRLLLEQLGLAARFFLAALQFGFRLLVGLRLSLIGARLAHVVALDERALLAHLDLNGASLTRCVGLLDLRRVPASQRDLALVAIGRTVRLAQMIEQTRLVRLRQRIVLARFLDARCLQLFEQHTSRHFQFRGKLGYVVTRHSFLLVQGPIPCG